MRRNSLIVFVLRRPCNKFNALGSGRDEITEPCKGETSGDPCLALSGLPLGSGSGAQGVALGWPVRPFQGQFPSPVPVLQTRWSVHFPGGH
jgi:hypothetical protein